MLSVELFIKKHLVQVIPDYLVSYLILFFLSFSISIALSSSLQSDAYPKNPDSVDCYYAYKAGWDIYKNIRKEWRPRLFSMVASSFIFPMERNGSVIKCIQKDFSHAFGIWVALWIFLLNLVYIAFDKNRAIIFMFLSFATIISAYCGIGGEEGHRPWDLPILFFSTLAVFLCIKGKQSILLFLLPLAMGFKETAIVFCLLLLTDSKKTMKQRCMLFLLTLFLCIAVKGVIDFSTNNPSPLLTMTTKDGMTKHENHLHENMELLFSLKGVLFLFTVNIGTILILIVLPTNRENIIYKVIALIFIALIFLFGRISETRIWFELLPLIMAGIHSWKNKKIKQEIGL